MRPRGQTNRTSAHVVKNGAIFKIGGEYVCTDDDQTSQEQSGPEAGQIGLERVASGRISAVFLIRSIRQVGIEIAGVIAIGT